MAFALVGTALLGALAAVAGLVGFTFLALGRPEGGQAETVRPPVVRRAAPLEAVQADERLAASLKAWDRHGPINILLLGLDHDTCAAGATGADGVPEAHKADTMIVVRIDPATGRAGMMSLPRDLFVYVPGYGGKKLTMAHYLGDLAGYVPGDGPGLAMQVVRENFDIPVHRFVRIDFEGFKRIIDTVGPLTVDVPPSPFDPTVGLVDSDYPDGSCGTMTISYPPGVQELDGERALQYARSRKSTSDFDRSRRQMQVLMALRERTVRPGIVFDIPKLLPALQSTVDTDLTTAEILSLGAIAPRIDPSSIVVIPIDENVVYDDMIEVDGVAQSILQRNPEAWRQARDRFMSLEAVEAAGTR